MALYLEEEILVSEASIDVTQEIWDVLSEAFAPYHKFYTEKAYSATVISPFEIKQRIQDPNIIVLIASYKKKIVGTASIETQGNNLHIRSMAVSPKYQRKGISSSILEKIFVISKESSTKTISLECFDPLIEAKMLYKKVGFELTGKKRTLHGIEVFEMIKRIH
ncbi:MAG: GNAT family N-acetyltransferase [Candidatus Hodarchaeota archaeon]